LTQVRFGRCFFDDESMSKIKNTGRRNRSFLHSSTTTALTIHLTPCVRGYDTILPIPTTGSRCTRSSTSLRTVLFDDRTMLWIRSTLMTRYYDIDARHLCYLTAHVRHPLVGLMRSLMRSERIRHGPDFPRFESCHLESDAHQEDVGILRTLPVAPLCPSHERQCSSKLILVLHLV
jgi:hypothetical protein